MYGVGQSMSYAGYRTKGIGSRAQMSLGAKVLEGVTLLQWGKTLGRRCHHKFNVGCLNFNGLPLPCDATNSPETMTAQPVESFKTSSS